LLLGLAAVLGMFFAPNMQRAENLSPEKMAGIEI
jgi:hypothetical protein